MRKCEHCSGTWQIEERGTIIKMVMTCCGCPTQYDAWTEDNKYIYFRLRHGYLKIMLDGEIIYERNDLEEDGIMLHTECLKHFEMAGFKINCEAENVYNNNDPAIWEWGLSFLGEDE